MENSSHLYALTYWHIERQYWHLEKKSIIIVFCVTISKADFPFVDSEPHLVLGDKGQCHNMRVACPR